MVKFHILWWNRRKYGHNFIYVLFICVSFHIYALFFIFLNGVLNFCQNFGYILLKNSQFYWKTVKPIEGNIYRLVAIYGCVLYWRFQYAKNWSDTGSKMWIFPPIPLLGTKIFTCEIFILLPVLFVFPFIKYDSRAN